MAPQLAGFVQSQQQVLVASASDGSFAPESPSGSHTPLALFHDPRDSGSDVKRTAFDLWRVHLEQCPECGHVHRNGSSAGSGRPERHIYEYTQGVADDLCCPLCGEVFQNPSQVPCGHHFCSACVRTLLNRGAGRAACPLDGHTVTRFAILPAESQLLKRLGELRIRCPVCQEDIRKDDLELHLQDPVSMVEPVEAYKAILHKFYMSCPLSNFTVGEFNGSSSLIRFYRKLGQDTTDKFILTTEHFIILPDPKMGFQPHTQEDIQVLARSGGYYNAWWVHPRFRREVWWHTDRCSEASCGHPNDAASRAFQEAVKKRDEAHSLLQGLDCSAEPWHESSFVHTWSTVRKPNEVRYLNGLRDLRGEDLPMLEQLQEDVLQFFKKNYSIDEQKVSIFVHYPSSARYSTLHFHIIFEGTHESKYTKYAKKLERPHQLSRQFSLSTVIDLLKKDPRHFETCTLNYFVGNKADLMDPISAFFGFSPHRYIGDFTFHWDPNSVLSKAASIDIETETFVGNSGSSAKVTPNSIISSHQKLQSDRILSELTDLRRSVEVLRHDLDSIRKVQQSKRSDEHGDMSSLHLWLVRTVELAAVPTVLCVFGSISIICLSLSRAVWKNSN